MANPFLNAIRHPFKAFGNVVHRAGDVTGYSAGSGLRDLTGLLSKGNLKYVFTPQTVFAAEGQAGTQKVNNDFGGTRGNAWEYGLTGKPQSLISSARSTPAQDAVTGGSSQTSQEAPFSQVFNGVEYTDPAAWYAAQLDYLDQVYGNTLNQGDQQNTLNQTSLEDQVTRALSDLLKQKETGAANRSNYYGSLGDIYQSSEDVNAQAANQEYDQAVGDVNRQKTTGLDSLSRALQSFRDQTTADYLAQRDQLLNQTGEYQDTLGGYLGGLQGVTPGVSSSGINDFSGQLANLQNLRSGQLQRSTGFSQGGKPNIQAILQYLQGLQ